MTEPEELLAVMVQPAPVVGQKDLFPDAVKEAGAQLPLQLLDLYGDGGGGVAQKLCRPGKAASFGDGNKGVQFFQVQVLIHNLKFPNDPLK